MFAPRPSLNHWRKISARFDLEMPVDIPVSLEGWARGMYDWIKAHPEIPIILGEGAKKAGALISHGYPVLAGAGIWMLRRQEKDDWGNKVDAPYLIPQIECFATEGREFIFAFDNDDKPSTRENVRQAIAATAELLTAKGCSASVVSWSDESEKGVDDLIAAQGIERFDRAVRERISVDEYNFNFFKEKQQEEYRNNRKFTPQIEIDREFVEVDFSAPNTIYLLDSALGTGKTYNLIKNLIKQRDKGMIMANYRNTLCLNFNERANEIGFYHYQSDKELEELSLDDPGIKVSLCIDSLSNFDSEQFDNKIIILDEVVSGIKHLLNSPTIRDFELIKNLFSEMIRRSDCVICLDGNMQDWVTKFVSTLAPNKQIVSLKNVYQGGRADVVMLDGVIKNEKVLKDTRSPYVKSALAEERPVVASSSQVFCESMEQIYQEQGRSGIRIDSKTTSIKKVKQFLKNPDRWIEKHQPEYVIYSPSAESGLDISIRGYFSGFYGFFFGLLDIDSIEQMIGRVRDVDLTRHVWIKSFIRSEDDISSPSNVTAVKAQRHTLLLEELNELIQSQHLQQADVVQRLAEIHQSHQDIFIETADRLQAIRNYELKNYRFCLAQRLMEKGHKVEFYRPNYDNDGDRQAGVAEKEAKEEVKIQNAHDTYNASDKYVGKKKINIAFDADWKERCAVKKAQIIRRLPGINHDRIWSPEFIKQILYDSPKLMAQIEQNYLLNNLEVARRLAIGKQNQIYNQGYVEAPWKVRSELPKLAAYRDVGLLALIEDRLENPDKEIDPESLEIQAILEKCSQPRYKKILGSPGKYPIRFIRRKLQSVGYELKVSKTKENGTVARTYYFDIDYLNNPTRMAIAKAVSLKYEQILNAQTTTLNWVVDSADLAEKQGL